MTVISKAETKIEDIIQKTDITASTTVQGFKLTTPKNDNSGSKLFDIVAKKSAEWLIGAAKVESLLKFNMPGNTLSDWNTGRSVFSVCTAQAGSPLPATLVMSAGDTGTGAKCTGVFNY